MRGIGVEFALLPETLIQPVEHVVDRADERKNLLWNPCGWQPQSRVPRLDFGRLSCQRVQWGKRSPDRQCADGENGKKKRNSEPAAVHEKFIEDCGMERLCHWHG